MKETFCPREDDVTAILIAADGDHLAANVSAIRPDGGAIADLLVRD